MRGLLKVRFPSDILRGRPQPRTFSHPERRQRFFATRGFYRQRHVLWHEAMFEIGTKPDTGIFLSVTRLEDRN